MHLSYDIRKFDIDQTQRVKYPPVKQIVRNVIFIRKVYFLHKSFAECCSQLRFPLLFCFLPDYPIHFISVFCNVCK